MMTPILEGFTALVAGVPRSAPTKRWVSNLTGTWITAAQATDPAYWAQHLRQPVRFADGVATLLADGDIEILEVGPGRTLGGFVRQHPAGEGRTPRHTLRAANERAADLDHLLLTLGQLWTAGVDVAWDCVLGGRAPAPRGAPYLSVRAPALLAPSVGFSPQALQQQTPAVKRAALTDWFYTPTWKRGVRARAVPAAAGTIARAGLAGAGGRLPVLARRRAHAAGARATR